MVDPSLGEVVARALDGVEAPDLARRLAVSALHLYARVGSTMDVAHRLAAAGAPSGTLVIAEEQLAGRGRHGRTWVSRPGDCLTFTLIERPREASGLEVLSLRLGLRAAATLDRWSEAPVRVKWPNDLYAGESKLAGILVEARWQGPRVDWVAVGFGLNVRGAPWPGAASLAAGSERVEILGELLPALRAAGGAEGALTDAELRAFRGRDWVRGRALIAPAAGVAAGISARGALVIDTPAGPVERSSGSIILAEETPDASGL